MVFLFLLSEFRRLQYALGSLLSTSSSLEKILFVLCIFPFEFEEFSVFSIVFKIRVSQ